MLGRIIGKVVAKRAAIALGGAMVGTALTAYFSARDKDDYEDAKFAKAEELKLDDDVLDEDKEKYEKKIIDYDEFYDLYATKKEKALIFMKTHWKTGLTMAVTFGLMILSHRSMAKEIAATAAALGVVRAKYDDINDYFRKNFPEEYKKFKEITNAESIKELIAEEKEKREFKKEESYDGRNRYFEPWSNQIFYATTAEFLDAQKQTNKLLMNTGEASLHNFLASFPKHCHIKLESWMTKIGWYCGDTTYEYNSSFYGPYLEVDDSIETITDEDGDEIEARVINWEIPLDFYPDIPEDEENEIARCMKKGA